MEETKPQEAHYTTLTCTLKQYNLKCAVVAGEQVSYNMVSSEMDWPMHGHLLQDKLNRVIEEWLLCCAFQPDLSMGKNGFDPSVMRHKNIKSRWIIIFV